MSKFQVTIADGSGNQTDEVTVTAASEQEVRDVLNNVRIQWPEEGEGLNINIEECS